MSWQVGHPIKRDGTNQAQRLLAALRPENNPIDARQKEDLLLFMYKMAKQFAYYNKANELDGNWQAFFDDLKNAEGEVTIESIRAFVEQAEQRQDNSTFITIILTFLKMFGYVQQDINKLTKKHLDYYYEKVLGFQRLPSRPDQVHVLFELAPQVQQHRIPIGTALKAGNDEQGNPLTYFTNREIIVNKAKIGAIKTSLVEPNTGRIYAAEVANSADGLGAPIEGEPKRWPTFGHPDNMQLSTVGFAIASPFLFLQEGYREIRFTLVLEELPDDLTKEDLGTLIPYASGEEGWMELKMAPTFSYHFDQANAIIIFEVIAFPSQGAIVPYNEDTLNSKLNTDFPVLQFRLDPNKSNYKTFKKLKVKAFELQVNVRAETYAPGLQNLSLYNDISALDSTSNFQPFGPEPSKNTHFYIGSQEAFSKPLDYLKIILKWANLPDADNGFVDHYAEPYDASYQGNGKFTADFQILKSKQWSSSFASQISLFEPSTGGKLYSDVQLYFNQNNNLSSLPLNPELQTAEELELSTAIQGFIRISLNKDFGHSIYDKLFAKVARGTTDPPNFPNFPYTPTLQSISIGYRSKQEIDSRAQDSDAQFFQLLPFGNCPLAPQNSWPLLPELPQGALYLGIEDLNPPQNLHLLFQMAAGSARSSDIIEKENIRWDYLTENGWRNTPLSGAEVFIDTTLGLQKSGIMAFNIGKDASKAGGILPASMHWLRATIDKDPAGATQVIAIHTQVTTAVFQDENNAPAHLLQPLLPSTITAMVQRHSAIRKVEQPYASFGGSPKEPDHRFYTRISERIRHKGRAITLWDIERLVLQQFPDLYEVKAIPHTGFDANGNYSEFRPGQVTVVAIPQLHNQNAVNPLQPSTSVAVLKEIRQFLAPLMSQFIGTNKNALHIINPFYEPIQLSFSVSFREGYDAGFYAEKLNQAIRQRLSPWAFEEGLDIRFGGRIYKSQLLAFVEEQVYVDYVTNFNMYHIFEEPTIGDMIVAVDLFVRENDARKSKDIAQAYSAASILVSADQHKIEVIQPGTYPCDEPSICDEGIGCTYIEIDFIVSNS